MSYRPLTDFWFLTRCKYKNGIRRYGGYLGGFPERARVLIGCAIDEPMLHVCGGLAKLYPYRGGFGEHDKTMDLDPECEPDFLQDCRSPDWPFGTGDTPRIVADICWGGILIDSAYSEEDQKRYSAEVQGKYPNPNQLVLTAIATLRIGRKVGIIHYVIPKCPANAKFSACVGIGCGFNNRIRAFSVFERLS